VVGSSGETGSPADNGIMHKSALPISRFLAGSSPCVEEPWHWEALPISRCSARIPPFLAGGYDAKVEKVSRRLTRAAVRSGRERPVAGGGGSLGAMPRACLRETACRTHAQLGV
jgi:hypothetical protein